ALTTNGFSLKNIQIGILKTQASNVGGTSISSPTTPEIQSGKEVPLTFGLNAGVSFMGGFSPNATSLSDLTGTSNNITAAVPAFSGQLSSSLDGKITSYSAGLGPKGFAAVSVYPSETTPIKRIK